MERILASIVVIDDVAPIPGADLIEVATVKGWKLVIKKGEYQPGDAAIYCEIDSFLPVTPDFEFLRKSSYRKMGDTEGFRLKTLKLRGQISQGLLLPVDMLNGHVHTLGEDVTAKLGIIKYEAPIPASLAGIMKGGFPSFIPKTDEERIQNLSGEYDTFRTHPCYVTEKLDGSSVTYYHRDGEFGVCSRNLELRESDDNTLWKVARKLDIPGKLAALGSNIAVQGELIGEGIQGNPYDLRGQTVYFFNAFNINAGEYLSMPAFLALMQELTLQHVPVLEETFLLPDTIGELLSFAEGAALLSPANKRVEREGLVIRSADRRISFKVISNKFLLGEA
ncbi:RNA ligase (ATP) [Chitinophaga arvensicola]|uniref:RNA ligase, DRB0094 family n=1 Tax=Chitinophaga arvensicola TaxID=29529 RepID=A0A1I0S7W8_9BACT|nr:RNA ligase (ATP) [Chitinophaga arvensicola]SEW51908.1 RNA ligase, DRB0094 family [Chitinophaga arvensicola]